MTSPASLTADAWKLALRAADVFAVDPAALGGVAIKSGSGPVRDQWLAYVASLCAAEGRFRRVPLHVTDERLLGGLDLAATLKAGKPIVSIGLLAEAVGGVLVLPNAERVSSATAARIACAMDRSDRPASFGLIALDESVSGDECPPPALLDRMAFLVDLDEVSHRGAIAMDGDREQSAAARAVTPCVQVGDDMIEALCAAAVAMGIDSVRAPMLAVKAARVLAALDRRACVTEVDATMAAQLVLAPRATRLPQAPSEPEAQDETEPPLPEQETRDDVSRSLESEALADIILEAAKAAIPPGLLAALQIEQARRTRGKTTGRAGEKLASKRHGRPAGVMRGDLESGARLNLVETLRAAAGWQPLRRRKAVIREGAALSDRRRVEVRKDDFRMTRFKNPTETTTIFVVDASGSSALNRLAEAKGAVELLLADCYIRRDSVAMISFRGKTAELLLPPTRSLARAKRSLAGLPGGGGTPLALGLMAACDVAGAVRRKGHTPSIIVLTDGRANIARDGSPGRQKAEIDSLDAARAIALLGVSSLVIDTSPKAAEQSERLAHAMSAVYLALPYADAAGLSNAVKAARGPSGLGRTNGV